MLEKFSLDSLKDMSKNDLLDLINQINNIPQEMLYLCVIIDITGIHVDTPSPDTDPDIVFTGGQLLSAAKAAYEISSNPLYMMFNKATIAGKEVYIDNKVVLAGTGVKHIPNAVCTSTGVIVINEAVLQMPTAQQNALILHEYGHRVLKHRATPGLYQVQLMLACGRSLQMEFDADEYAVKNGGDMLSLLQHCHSTYPELRTKAVRKRIEKLEGYYAKFKPAL